MNLTRIALTVVAAACLAFPPGGNAEDAEAAARRGTRLYGEGRYEEAAEAFQRARELARKKGDPPPAFDYNLGTTYARQGEFDRAVETLRGAAEAPEPEDTPELQERAFYNIGVSAARKAEAFREQGESQLNAEYEVLGQALDAFRRSLILDPDDESARHNFALTQRRIREIESRMQQQQQPQDQQSGTESSDPQQSDEGQQQDQPSENGQPGENENQEPSSGETSSPSGEGEPSDSQGDPSRRPDSSQQQPPDPETSEEAQSNSQPQDQPSPNEAERTPRENEDAARSRDRDEASESSERGQRGGLEATPTPTPEQTPTPSEGEASTDQDQSSEPSGAQSGASAGAGNGEELTPEQLNALRVLNSLEEGHPDQFRQLFRFRGGERRNLERDW